MKRLGFFIFCGLLSQLALGQSMDMKELTQLLDLSQGKLESHLQKKGYKKLLYNENGDLNISYTKFPKHKSKQPQELRSFQINSWDNGYELTYNTTCESEDSLLKKEIISMGFSYAAKAEQAPVLYQKHNISIEAFTKTVDTSTYYVLKARKKELPKKKDILGAEDLLKLDAHEYLVEVFGKENVKTDVFYFSETETNKCSVLYPNSNREAFFIWDDEVNMRNLDFVVIGGSLKPRVNTNSVNQVSHNSWISRQGVYCGMTLKEIEKLNEAPLRFYNWDTESAGYLAPHNKGTIDFTRLSLVFNCLNCSFTKVASSQITESDYALQENQKVYVTTLIILPDKKDEDTRAQRH
jgi:hypothetical protein